MPAKAAALATLCVQASASRKRSCRSAVQPSLRILREGGGVPIHQLGPQMPPCRTAFVVAALGGKLTLERQPRDPYDCDSQKIDAVPKAMRPSVTAAAALRCRENAHTA